MRIGAWLVGSPFHFCLLVSGNHWFLFVLHLSLFIIDSFFEKQNKACFQIKIWTPLHTNSSPLCCVCRRCNAQCSLLFVRCWLLISNLFLKRKPKCISIKFLAEENARHHHGVGVDFSLLLPREQWAHMVHSQHYPDNINRLWAVFPPSLIFNKIIEFGNTVLYTLIKIISFNIFK